MEALRAAVTVICNDALKFEAEDNEIRTILSGSAITVYLDDVP